MKSIGKFGLSVIPLIFLAACGTRVQNSSSGTSTPVPTPVPTSPPTVTPTVTPSPTAVPFTGVNPFEIVLNSQYQVTGGGTSSGPTTTEIDCVIPPGTASGNVSTCNPIIPEGRLYFSTLTWTVNVGTQDQTPPCEIVTFQPYYYQASNTAGFFPSWVTTAVDCSVSPINASCFSGPATVIVPSFPEFRGMYFAVSTGSNQTYTASSANFNTRSSNRWTVNNLAVGSYGVSHTFLNGRDAYLANTFVNYQFACNDRYMQPVYIVNMTIVDQDIVGIYPNTSQGNRAINQYPDWDPASWDF